MYRLHGVAAVVCIAVFLFGLFPVSPRALQSPDVAVPDAVVERIVWVVIDALRGDFELLPIDGVQGVAFDCLAPSPTVTLPRLFALVTGSEPSFSQALRNFGGAASLGEDSLIERWKKRRKVFYGDDTWLRLFPASLWDRSEGVTSFAVRDTVEVDSNVTRNARQELRRKDWDVMVLHYLGIDHVGHSLGPQHPRLKEKLGEMREILAEIAQALGPKDLIVVSGDHGMTAEGNHGGNTAQETSTQHLFLRKSSDDGDRVVFVLRSCHQADVTATLAELSGERAPVNCLGEPLDEAVGMAGGSALLSAQRARHRLHLWARSVAVEVRSGKKKKGWFCFV
jgi:ethanolaminephosphotransferase